MTKRKGSKVELFQLEQFQAIAECGTMREAAEKLYLTQPTLSRNLKKLESELGCQLFTRVHNQLRISPYGEIVLDYVREFTSGWNDMVERLEAEKRRDETTLHIGCFSPPVSSFIMPRVSVEMQDRAFEVVNCDTAALVEGIETGRFDLLIATDICRSKTTRWRLLYEEEAFVSAPLSAALPMTEGASKEDLAGMSFTIESGLAGYSDWFTHILREAGVPEESIDHIPLDEHLRTKDLLPTCNLITSFIIRFVRTNEDRAIIPITEDFAKRGVGLVYRHDAPEKVRFFVQHLRRNIESFLGGHLFMQYYFYPDKTSNLRITDE